MRLIANIGVKAITVLGLALAATSALADYAIPKLNMHRGVTPLSFDIYDLHMVILGIVVIIGVIVFSVLIYSIIMHRKSRGVRPAEFHEHTKLEVLWAIIPLVILVVMAIPATIVLVKMNDTRDSDVTIKVTGYQWKWEYQYLDQGISFFSTLSTPLAEINNQKKKNKWYLLQVDNPLVVPTHKKIRFLVTSNDVIHSWWVPALGIKKDAIPGFIHEAWAEISKPGVYRGQCAELCGVNHGFMPIVVIAKTPAEFQKWVEKEKDRRAKATRSTKEKYTYQELMDIGKKGYDKHCSACHQANGRGISPIYPALRGSSIAVGHPISRHIDVVLNGVPGTAMQAFGKQLSNVEIAAIITYERNAWQNNTGDIVQPNDVQ